MHVLSPRWHAQNVQDDSCLAVPAASAHQDEDLLLASGLWLQPARRVPLLRVHCPENWAARLQIMDEFGAVLRARGEAMPERVEGFVRPDVGAAAALHGRGALLLTLLAPAVSRCCHASRARRLAASAANPDL